MARLDISVQPRPALAGDSVVICVTASGGAPAPSSIDVQVGTGATVRVPVSEEAEGHTVCVSFQVPPGAGTLTATAGRGECLTTLGVIVQ